MGIGSSRAPIVSFDEACERLGEVIYGPLPEQLRNSRLVCQALGSAIEV